jgi:hypothetical protein
VLCTAEFVRNFCLLFLLKLINTNVHLDRRAKIHNLLQKLLPEFVGFYKADFCSKEEREKTDV